jgi:hypothetical protein
MKAADGWHLHGNLATAYFFLKKDAQVCDF